LGGDGFGQLSVTGEPPYGHLPGTQMEKGRASSAKAWNGEKGRKGTEKGIVRKIRWGTGRSPLDKPVAGLLIPILGAADWGKAG